jgi:hypothetical protein
MRSAGFARFLEEREAASREDISLAVAAMSAASGRVNQQGRGSPSMSMKRDASAANLSWFPR